MLSMIIGTTLSTGAVLALVRDWLLHPDL